MVTYLYTHLKVVCQLERLTITSFHCRFSERCILVIYHRVLDSFNCRTDIFQAKPLHSIIPMCRYMGVSKKLALQITTSIPNQFVGHRRRKRWLRKQRYGWQENKLLSTHESQSTMSTMYNMGIKMRAIRVTWRLPRFYACAKA